MASDYFDQAGQGIDQGKAALLQAIATQGSQAHAAIQAGQDQIAAAKQAAIQQALQGAQQRGAQQPELDQLTRTVSQPYDAQLAGLASSQASRDAGFAQQGTAAGTYMDEARAGLPALRTQLAQKVASMQAAAQAQASTFAQNQQLKNIELQIAQANLAKSQQAGAAAANPGVGKILSDQFGGLSGFQDLVTSQAPALRAGQNADYRDQQAALRSLGAHGNLAARADSRENDPGLTPLDVADALGQSAGLGAGQGAALYQPYLDRQAAADAKQSGTDSDSAAYARGAAYAAKAAAAADGGYTAQQFAADINGIPGMTPVAAAKVISEYGHLFPNSAAPGYVPPPKGKQS